ncbi:MAG: hypothetical protein DRH37_08700 [Deltaproteobacteria bacterium]|nr:MAG: hypothetical protein DRH37_08700 [Deltaproteobacteria bacterium]
MARSIHLIFNHTFTALQRQDAVDSLGVDRIQDMPPDLKSLWRNIPPDLPRISGYLEPVKAWLKGRAERGDYVLIQGDFGACHIMVNFALAHDLIPVYSTTERIAVEAHGEDGTVKLTHHFKHRIFRRYGL